MTPFMRHLLQTNQPLVQLRREWVALRHRSGAEALSFRTDLSRAPES